MVFLWWEKVVEARRGLGNAFKELGLGYRHMSERRQNYSNCHFSSF